MFCDEKPTKAAVHRCSSKQVSLKISQYSQENTCAGVSLLTLLNQQGYRKSTSCFEQGQLCLIIIISFVIFNKSVLANLNQTE